MKITSILFESEQKMFMLPFPIYCEKDKLIKADILIAKISKYKWPKKRQEEYKDLCNRIKNWEKSYYQTEEEDLLYEPSR